MTATSGRRSIRESATPRTTQASGSTIAACRNESPSARGTTFWATMRAGMQGELGVGAVPEEQVVAEVLAAGRGRSAQAPQGAELATTTLVPALDRDAFPDRLHHPRDLVAEHGGRLEHPRVVAPPIDLDVGATGERRLVAEQDLARARDRDREVLDPDVFLAMEDGRPHGGGHDRPISTTTFSTPGAGREATSTARADSSSGKRCVTSERTSICRSNTSRAARSWMSAEEL